VTYVIIEGTLEELAEKIADGVNTFDCQQSY
jgi:hypothetical protein